MKKVLLVLVTVALLTSCGKSLRSAGGEVTGVRSVAFNEPAPYGMVLVKRGSFEMGPGRQGFLVGNHAGDERGLFRRVLDGSDRGNERQISPVRLLCERLYYP